MQVHEEGGQFNASHTGGINVLNIFVFDTFFLFIDSTSMQGTLNIAVLPWPAQQRFSLLT